jgi:hypothetical protein
MYVNASTNFINYPWKSKTYITKFKLYLSTEGHSHFGAALEQKFENGEHLFGMPHFTKDALWSFCPNPMVQCAPNGKVVPWCAVRAEFFIWPAHNFKTRALNRP